MVKFILLALLLVSCGDEAKNNSAIKEVVEDAPLGLSGNTYRNQRFLFKISNLPVDKWTIYFTEYSKQLEQFNLVMYGEDFDPKSDVQLGSGGQIMLIIPQKSITEDELLMLHKKIKQTAGDFILMDIEETGDDIKSPKDLAEAYKINKKDSFTLEEEGEVRTNDGFVGYRLDGKWSNGTSIGYAFFTRSTSSIKRKYRFVYTSDVKTEEVKDAFNQIINSLEFNIL